MLLFLVTLFISPSILSLWELHALSLYKPLALHRLETPGLVLREGQLQSDGAVDERASPRPGLTGHYYTADFCLFDAVADPGNLVRG